MKDQIQSKMSVSQQLLRTGWPVRLMMIGALLVAISTLLPMRDVLNVLTLSPETDAHASAASETSQAEAVKDQWQLTKRDPAILKALHEEWQSVKEKFDADFGTANRLKTEADIAHERLDEWQTAKRDPAIINELHEEWRAVKQAFEANFGAHFANTR